MSHAPATGPGAAPEPVGDPRAERVGSAVRAWQRALADLGGRNTLLWYRDLPLGTLDLTTAHPGGVSMLLAGRRTRLSDLVREPVALEEARRRARAVHAKALELREERGIPAGFIAVGMATWSPPRAPRPPASPVLLRPCVLRPTAAAQEDFELDLSPEVAFNPVLREYLRSEQGLDLDADELAERASAGGKFDPYPVYAALSRACAHVPDFTVTPRLVLATFSATKSPMVADLTEQGEVLADHDVVAALAGDASALAAVRMPVPDPSPDPDPEREHLVLDADSSQQAAIDAVRAGAHLVIQGPPGTGKSQTIANLVAALAADGKSTLFVAEKRASIDAVIGRLATVGLGDLVLDAYDGVVNRRSMAAQLAESLGSTPAPAPSPRRDDSVAVLRDRRQRLVEHVAALHRTREPWGVCAHDVQEAMVGLASRTPAPLCSVRLNPPVIDELPRKRVVELGRRLRDAVGLGAWTAEGADPWFGARIITPEDATQALELTTRLSATGLPAAAERLDAIMADSHVPAATCARDWVSAFDTMARVRETLEVFRPEVFDVPLTEPIAATGTAAWRQAHGIQMGWATRWRVKQQTKRLLRPGRPPAHLHEELLAASEQRSSWFRLVGGGGRPAISGDLDEGLDLLDEVTAELEWLAARLAPTAGGSDLLDLPLADLRARLAALADRPDRLAVLPQVTGTLDELRAAGLGEVVSDLASRGVPAELVPAEVDHVWWASVAQEISRRDPRYGGHDGPALRRAAEEYAAADHAHLEATVARVRAAVAARIGNVLAGHPDQAALVRSEAGKVRRHRPLRDLLPDAAPVLTALRPCWAMSPLVVAATLPPGRWFDVVVLDEASSVTPAEAVSAISRASQVVVVGDERQLPPTGFATVAADDDSTAQVLDEGRESVLDVLAACLPTRHLTWHYRSLDERLVAFSNEAFYDGSLTTFPGVHGGFALAFVPVEGQAEVSPGAEAIETTPAEVARVVELVLDHARTRPHESLGVVALGTAHADRLRDAVRAALQQSRDLAPFFAEDRDERFFVKHVEQVQGDERDAVILSVGYGKTPHGRVLHRFGPLSLDGGERRLNVAVTRARARMTVVSALRAADLDPERLKAPGALLLRSFLAYAESGGAVLPAAGPGAPGAPPAADPVRHEVVAHDLVRHDLAARLRREGLVVHEAVGRSGQPVDLVVEDPYRRGRPLVAVETDGPAYAALRSTRERDRLRPEQLRRLGWEHVRVWSTDVFRDPAREVARIVRVAHERSRAADGPAARGTAASAAEATGASTAEVTGASAADGTATTPTPGAEAIAAGGPPVSDASGEGRRKRRRVFRRGTGDAPVAEEGAAYGSSLDVTDADTDAETQADTDADSGRRERWLQEQRPPHYE